MRFGSRRAVVRDPLLVLQEEEARMFDVANEGLRRDAEIWWPHQLFLSSSPDVTTYGPCPAVIDATGRSRHLIFGPFQTLAPGRWRASVALRISAPAARRPLAVDFGAGENFILQNLPYGVPGLHRIELENTFGETDQAQFRLWVKRAAFEGEIGFQGVALKFVGAPPLGPALSEGGL